MLLKIITFLALFLLSLIVSAQDIGTGTCEHEMPNSSRLSIKAEYFGELVLHPGLSLGVEYRIAQNKWTTIHWNTDLGGYWHRWNNTSAFLKSSIGSRFALGSAFADLNVGVGYMHSWAAGDVYQRAADGGVEKVANWGHSHFMPNASFLIGWDGSRKKQLPWTVHFGPEVYLQSSFNHSYLPHVAAKLGFTYKLEER